MTTIVVLGLILIKAYAFVQSGSLSILSSLTDSILDVGISLVALASVISAARPADADHRWGHGKIEAVSALMQSTVIIGGAVFLLFESLGGFLEPTPITSHKLGITVMLISIAASVGLVALQTLTRAKVDSLVSEGESLNYGTDALLNVGTVVVLVMSQHGAPFWIDPLFTCFASILMVFMARKLFMKALDMLLDRELPDADRAAIIAQIEQHPAVLSWHDLRTRCHGRIHDISFDIELDRTLSLLEAHEVTKDLERSLVELYPFCDVMIHVDPEGSPGDERHRVKGIHI